MCHRRQRFNEAHVVVLGALACPIYYLMGELPNKSGLTAYRCYLYGLRARITCPGSGQFSEVRCQPGTVPQRSSPFTGTSPVAWPGVLAEHQSSKEGRFAAHAPPPEPCP